MDRWIDHVVWWHAYPLGFVGAEPEALPDDAAPIPRLDRFEPWLDYLVDLGCNGLALGPVFASETHGYDTVDFRRIDPRLGDDAAFDRLVRACRPRGIRILLDGVFNHVGRSFPQFRQALTDGPASEAGRWFRWSGDSADARSTGGAPVPESFEGHDKLVSLNHDEPAVRAHVADVMTHWLDRGADGWRLDAAYQVPSSFWAAVLPAVRERHPDAWFVGEVIHGDYAAVVSESGMDSVTQYELWKSVWSSLNDGNLHELAWNLSRHEEMLTTFTPLTFVGNHDVTRIASRLENPAHLGHAVAVLMTVGGIPSVYAGDEQAFTGIKEEREHGDDAIRPPFPDTPADLAPFGATTRELHQQLIGLRRRHPWLVDARTTVEHVTDTTMALRSAPRHDGGGGLVLLLSADDEPFRFPDELHGEVLAEATATDDPLHLAPHTWRILTG
ncbi:alpha-amylase family protein [Pseudonocardia sp. KRD291]|uniref:alpha-amylase family protein n=1 Tax=Pseudonocardia sp. KRD291 TaxID=2792007 RepID=UPI001C4A3919|nr:alpha-amylase family protein [Pseudonocardia sp. KRD291]MBW0105889.1 alpha-amylase family protein [Pseudonocardia sp. KRD291]